VPFLEHDALLYPYMEAVHELVTSDQIVTTVDGVVENTRTMRIHE
jgi:hypothetical protein